MTNHKTEAMNYLTASTVDTHGDDDRKVAIAQVHATLYLAEQQRLANQIAYAMLLEAQDAEAAKDPAQYDHDSRPASIARHTLVLEQIREGLGL